MHPVLLLTVTGALTLADPAPTDSVIWLPLYYDGWYARPNGAPTWSPDGEQLAFSYYDYMPPQYFNTNLHILQSDGTWRQCILESLTFGGAAWSPLGGEIAANNLGKIVAYRPDNCGYIREIVGGSDPQWSRDGQRIVFSVGPVYDAAIYTVAAAGGDVRHVVDDGIQPDWSPDGTSIVFVRAGNLWIVSVEGTDERQITQSGQDGWPAWSRDGGSIAFSRWDPVGQLTGVWLVGTSGGPGVQVTPFVEGQTRTRPCWSHDGTRLAYFVMTFPENRIGIGILRDPIPLAVQPRTWSAVKKSFR